MTRNQVKTGPLERTEAFMEALRVLLVEAEGDGFHELQLNGLNLRVGHGYGAESLLVVKASDPDGKNYVAFHSGTAVEATLIGGLLKYARNEMDWKEDAWNPGNGSGTAENAP